jgi:hypothetical protein
MSPKTCAPQFETHYTPEPRNWMRLLGTPLPYCSNSLRSLYAQYKLFQLGLCCCYLATKNDFPFSITHANVRGCTMQIHSYMLHPRPPAFSSRRFLNGAWFYSEARSVIVSPIGTDLTKGNPREELFR